MILGMFLLDPYHSIRVLDIRAKEMPKIHYFMELNQLSDFLILDMILCEILWRIPTFVS